MLSEMIPIILLLLTVVLSSAQGEDNVQPSQLPDGKICLFTCSEWIFQEKVQQFAPSADLLGPGYLSKHQIGLSSNEPNHQGKEDAPLQYQKVWGAVYSIKKEEYDAVLKQSQSEYSVPFASNEDVFVVKYKEMNCLVVDLGIQPGDHPPWRHFNMKIPNTLQDDAYYNRLAQIGVPPDYINGLRNSSCKPQYHPIIPRDYHPRQVDQKPKRTYNQLPTARQHPNPHPIDEPITGQIPEVHDREIPGLTLPDAPVTTDQPDTHKKLLPGVINPNSQPKVITDVPASIVQPDTHDLAVTVPKDIDSGVGTTPDHQPVVVITPMKLPGSSQVQPVVAKPVDTLQGQSPVVSGKVNDSNVIVPSNGPLLTNHQPKKIDDTVPTEVSGVSQPISHDTIGPTVSGTPQMPTDQSHVVITPLKLSQNGNNDTPVPVVGQDYTVQTPLSLQPGDNQHPLVPTTIDDDSTKPKNVPPILLSGSKQPSQIVPDNTISNQPTVAQQPLKQGLLTPDTIAPPRLATQAPDQLINSSPQLGKEPVLETLPTSYDVPCNHDIPGSNSGLLTLSPINDLTPVQQTDSPLLTLNNAPQTDNSIHPVPHPDQVQSVPTPNVLNVKPGQQIDNPSVLVNQPTNKPTLVSHQINPGTLDSNNNPDLLQTNIAPDNMHLQPSNNHPVQPIPASFSAPKPVPILPKKPMFELNQSNQPNNVNYHDIPATTSNNKPTPITDQSTPDTVTLNKSPDLVPTNTGPNQIQVHPSDDHTIQPISSSFGVPKPAPIIQYKPMFTLDQPVNSIKTTPQQDKPMFTLDQPAKPNKVTPVSYQVNPNSLDVNNNPDKLSTNTAPDHLQLHPTDNQPIQSIPASHNVSKPTAILPDKPMFGFDQCKHPSSNIPANYGVVSQPPAFEDKPMFTLDNSTPLELKPKHIDDDNSNIPLSTTTAPVNTINQPHATGLLPDLSHQPNQFASQPNNVPVITSNPAPTTVHQLPTSIDNSHPVQVTSKPNVLPLETTHTPNPSLVQVPKPIVQHDNTVPLASKADNISPATITQPAPASVVNNNHPVLVTSKPNNVPLDTSHTSNPVQSTSKPDNTIPITASPDIHTIPAPNQISDNGHLLLANSKPHSVSNDESEIPKSAITHDTNPVVSTGNPTTVVAKPDTVPVTSSHPTVTQDHPEQLIAQQPTKVPLTTDHPINTAGPVQAQNISAQPVQPIQHVSPPPTYTPSTFMAPNYTPVSPALGYTYAYRYPQYLHNSTYKPPNTYYHPDELIPGFTFGSHIQLC